MSDGRAPNPNDDHQLQSTPAAVPETVPQGVSRRRLRLKVAGLVVAVLIALAIIGLLVWLFEGKSSDNTGSSSQTGTSSEPVAKVCDQNVLSKANGYMVAHDIAGLSGVSNTVQTLKGYQNDPNCMYTVVQSDLFTADVTQASAHYAQLKTLLGQHPDFAYSNAFQPRPMSLSDIEGTIAAEKANQAQDVKMNVPAMPVEGNN